MNIYRLFAMKHMNLRSSFLAMLIFMAADILAQTPRTFVVKEVGDKPIILHQDKKKRNIAPRDLLPLSAMISIPKGGKLVVYDNVRMSEYTIKEPGMNTLAKFLDGSSKESYTKITFAGLIAMLFSEKGEQRDLPATIYRGGGTESENNSLDEYVLYIREVLRDSTTNLPEGYAIILTEVLKDIESQNELPADSIAP
jgi:hypothetical protein